MALLRIFVATLALLFAGSALGENDNPLSKLAWQYGPGQASIGDKATIKIPEGYAFLGAADTKKFLEMNQNLASGKEYLLAPESLNWFAIFEFDPVGYVKDDETINADDVLQTVKEGTEQANEERKRRGWSTMTIQGWRFQPQYDNQAKLLEWAFLAKNDATNTPIINYNTRLLGRSGVMEVILVGDPATLDQDVAALKTALADFDYVPGEKYAEFKQGDHVAEYGLAALVAGGAAAVAAKKGFFGAIAAFFAAAWKMIAAAGIAVLAWLKSVFKKKDE